MADIFDTAGTSAASNPHYFLSATELGAVVPEFPTRAEVQAWITASTVRSGDVYYTGTDTATDEHIFKYTVDVAGFALQDYPSVVVPIESLDLELAGVENPDFIEFAHTNGQPHDLPATSDRVYDSNVSSASHPIFIGSAGGAAVASRNLTANWTVPITRGLISIWVYVTEKPVSDESGGVAGMNITSSVTDASVNGGNPDPTQLTRGFISAADMTDLTVGAWNKLPVVIPVNTKTICLHSPSVQQNDATGSLLISEIRYVAEESQVFNYQGIYYVNGEVYTPQLVGGLAPVPFDVTGGDQVFTRGTSAAVTGKDHIIGVDSDARVTKIRMFAGRTLSNDETARYSTAFGSFVVIDSDGNVIADPDLTPVDGGQTVVGVNEWGGNVTAHTMGATWIRLFDGAANSSYDISIGDIDGGTSPHDQLMFEWDVNTPVALDFVKLSTRGGGVRSVGKTDYFEVQYQFEGSDIFYSVAKQDRFDGTATDGFVTSTVFPSGKVYFAGNRGSFLINKPLVSSDSSVAINEGPEEIDLVASAGAATVPDVPEYTMKMRNAAGTGPALDIEYKDLFNLAAPSGTHGLMTFNPTTGQQFKSTIAQVVSNAASGGTTVFASGHNAGPTVGLNSNVIDISDVNTTSLDANSMIRGPGSLSAVVVPTAGNWEISCSLTHGEDASIAELQLWVNNVNTFDHNGTAGAGSRNTTAITPMILNLAANDVVSFRTNGMTSADLQSFNYCVKSV